MGGSLKQSGALAGSHYMAQGTDVLKEWCEDDTGVTRNKLCTVREIAERTG